MRKFFAFMAVALLMAATTTAFAVVIPQNVTITPRGDLSDVPARAPDGFGRADTIGFGYYTIIGGTYYAVLGEKWTWDHNPGPGPIYNREGWFAVDESQNAAAYFKRITAATWSGHGNTVPAPILRNTASAWLGVFEDESIDLCWAGGLGYGNRWCQQLISPDLQYTGNGDLSLTFYYFNDTELNFDYSKVYMQVVGADELLLNAPGFSSKIGINPPPTIPTATLYSRNITQQEVLGGDPPGTQKNLRFYFEMTSLDGGWSDEDGGYTTDFGPFGVDDIQVAGNITEAGPLRSTPLYNFEAGLQGWTAAQCQAVGSFFSIEDLGDYNIQDPCGCELQGKVATFHDPNRNHPRGQRVTSWSPRVRKSIDAPYPTWNKIMADWDMYAEMPQTSAVFYRPGWYYYPYVCPWTGETIESGRQGQGGYFYVGEQPACFGSRNIGTDWGVPQDAQVVGFVFEVYSSCDAFGMPDCPDYTQFTNFTPVIDNVQIRFTGVTYVNAPAVAYEPGTRYRDNFPQGDRLSVTGLGQADIVYDIHRDPPPDIPDLLGDSLEVAGAIPTVSTRYLTRLWFRVKREGPGQVHIARYRTWKAKVADGINIVGETTPNKGRNFTFGWMDSVEVGTRVALNKFCSQFHETDDDFTSPEQGEDNEIIWDNMLTPGTKIQFFVTSNYFCTPNQNLALPDTTGQNYEEFEILPSYRSVQGGVYKYPCVLYVDAFQSVFARYYIEHAMNNVLTGANINDPIPDPAAWDRYDYINAASNWCAPMFRNPGGNSGAALLEMLGYRFIMVNTGTLPEGTMRKRDWQGFESWMTATDCVGSPQPRQGFWANGDDVAKIINSANDIYGYPPFLATLGSFFDCDRNYEEGCPTNENPANNDTLYCTKLRPVPGGSFQPAFAIENFGNWCPAQYPFDVLGTAGSGSGNKNYQRKSDDTFVSNRYAQVTNDQAGSASNYRTVLDGYSLSHIIRPDLAQGQPGECVPDTTRVIQAILEEFTKVLTWTLGSVPADLCVDPCTNYTGPTSDVLPLEAGLVNRLYQNSPNPFNPRTTIRFSLAADAPAKLVIYDVNGRKVKTLVNGAQKAGLHELIWDGTDDAGHPVSSGIFWSQLTAGDYTSNRKMVVLK